MALARIYPARLGAGKESLERGSRPPSPVRSQRSETTQVWTRPEGGFSTEIFGGPVRFREGNAWKQVDLTLRRTPDGAVEPVGHPRGLRLSGVGSWRGWTHFIA